MKRTLLIAACVAVLVVAAGFVVLRAAPSIGATSVMPTVVAANAPTQVTVTAQITDSALVAASVNLLRLDTNGNAANIGTMYDDGTNGDATAGDKTFTRTVTLNEAAGMVNFQVSAAFRGLLRRISSPNIAVGVWASYSDAEDGYSLIYPPNLSPQRVTAGRTRFTPAVAELDGDEPGAIEIFVLPGAYADQVNRVRSSFVTDFSQHAITVDGQTGLQMTGILDDNVFGWGGQPHGYVLVPLVDGVLRIGYDTGDPSVNGALTTIVANLHLR